MRSPRRLSRAALAAAVAGCLLTAAAPASAEFESKIQRLPASVRAQLVAHDSWRPGCPVPMSKLRLLAVTHWGFDRKEHTGEAIVNVAAAEPLAEVFARLHELRFRIRHLSVPASYGPKERRPDDGDISGAFECRQAVPSPCSGGTGTGTWSRHAYGLAIDLNPRENPYVGCGKLRNPERAPYVNRSRIRPGMVTPAVVRAFKDVGWSWGGDWTGDTKDYMHFSADNR